MSDTKGFRVSDESGFIGILDAPARFLDNRAEKVIKLDAGGELIVRSEELKVQPDGTFRLLGHGRTTGISVTDVSDTPSNQRGGEPEVAREQQPPAPAADALAAFYTDDYDIERVAVGKILDTPCEARQEGDTFVLPVLEEVLVYQKKMLLKEEVRITRRRKAVSEVRKIEQPAR